VGAAVPTGRGGTDGPADVYERLRIAFVDTSRSVPASALAVPVPATPAWSVHDVLAHVIGLAADLNALRFPEADDLGGDRFSAVQVAERRDRSLDELVAEWDREAPQFEAGLRAFGYELGSHFVADLCIHHHDVRAALQLPDMPDPVAVAVSLDHYLGHVHEQIAARGDGCVRFVTPPLPGRPGGIDRTVGTGPVIATLRAGGFVLLRTLAARVPLHTVRRMAWEGDADTAIELLVSAYRGGYSFPP
jgi:uncharacterized protein (TIGR03083 family)